jgi:hypothetical protein
MSWLVVLMFRRRKARVELADFVVFEICSFHFRSFEMVMPRYFAEATLSRVSPCRWYLQISGVLDLAMFKILHLSGWNSISQSLSQRSSECRSSCRASSSLRDIMVR